MDTEQFEMDVWESVNESLYDAQVGSLTEGDQVVTIGETWQGTLYGTEENTYGQRAVHVFYTEEHQRQWFDAVSADL